MAPRPRPPFVITACGPVTVVLLTDRTLDETAAHHLGDRLLPLADLPGLTALHLDFRAVECVSSMGLGKLITLYKRTAAAGVPLALLNVRPLLRDLFHVTRLEKLFDVRRPDAARPAALGQDVREGQPEGAA